MCSREANHYKPEHVKSVNNKPTSACDGEAVCLPRLGHKGIVLRKQLSTSSLLFPDLADSPVQVFFPSPTGLAGEAADLASAPRPTHSSATYQDLLSTLPRA